jgi:hypothetical protein
MLDCKKLNKKKKTKTKTKKTEHHEMEPNLLKDRAMLARDDRSFGNETIICILQFNPYPYFQSNT